MNDDAITAGEGDFAREDELGLDGPLMPDEGLEPEPETCQIEFEGHLYEVPIELKGAFLRQADYTRKTQELAEHRRGLEAERAAVIDRLKLVRGEGRDRAYLAALDDQLEDFAAIDWDAFGQAEPQRAQALWARFQETQDVRERYAHAISHHDQQDRLEKARDAADRMAQTGQALRTEIEGWSPEVAAKLVDYAQAFGVTLEELAEVADARLWKILHRAYQGEQAQQRDTVVAAQAVRPAVSVTGAAAAGPGVRDELATREWMQRRNDQTRKGR